MTDPDVAVYLPGGHLVCAMQASIAVLLIDAEALKNPDAHASHVGWEKADPAVIVYFPGAHLVWAMQLTMLLDVETLKNPAGHGLQASIAVLLIDAEALKNPDTHALHVGWEKADPAVIVYLPGAHLVWAMQESVLNLLLDVATLKNPAGHAVQLLWVVAVPIAFVYFPGGHLVWAAHNSEGQRGFADIMQERSTTVGNKQSLEFIVN